MFKPFSSALHRVLHSCTPAVKARLAEDEELSFPEDPFADDPHADDFLTVVNGKPYTVRQFNDLLSEQMGSGSKVPCTTEGCKTIPLISMSELRQQAR